MKYKRWHEPNSLLFRPKPDWQLCFATGQHINSASTSALAVPIHEPRLRLERLSGTMIFIANEP